MKCNLILPRRSGQRRIFEAWNETFQVKKLRGGEYFLAVWRGEGMAPLRSRFGNAKQIRQDIQHVCETGALPRGGVY